jgi:hypothetical protein
VVVVGAGVVVVVVGATVVVVVVGATVVVVVVWATVVVVVVGACVVVVVVVGATVVVVVGANVVVVVVVGVVGQPLPLTLQFAPATAVTNVGVDVLNVPDTKHLTTVCPAFIVNNLFAQSAQSLPLYEY